VEKCLRVVEVLVKEIREMSPKSQGGYERKAIFRQEEI